ncbi:hypothetical protein EG833_02130, partial [archaeon]|nr:hypothetical protein [archaeon]
MGRSNTRIIILIGSAIFILVLLSTRQYSSSSFGIRYIREGYYVFEKVVRTPFSFVGDIWDTYIGLVNTSRENKDLRKQIDQLKVRNMQMEELKSENRLLRGM